MTGSSRPARPGRDAFVDRLVRWGGLEFADFARLDPAAARSLLDPADPDWAVALNNTPKVWAKLPIADCRSAICPGQTAAAGQIGNRRSEIGDCALAEVRAAQSRLVCRHWRELLAAKAPALYDALPWHDVDIGPLLRGRRLWQTRFLLAGGHASVTACRLRRTAGAYAVEPNPALANYIERKAALEKVKNLRVLRATLDATGLPDGAVHLAIVEAPGEAGLVELERVAFEVAVLDTDPLRETDPGLLHARGYRESAITTRFGPATAWVRPPAA